MPGVLDVRSGYDIAECYRVQTNGQTPVVLFRALPGTVIERVLVRVEVPGTGAAMLMVGDEDDPDCFVLSADHVQPEGTVYGDVTTERGTYLYTATPKGGHVKLYEEEKDIEMVLSATPTTDGIHQVFVVGQRYSLG